MAPDICGIYAITHRHSGTMYVGSSSRIRQRLNTHRYELKCGIHSNPHLQRAWNKYEAESFDFSILELVDDVTMLHVREQFHLDEHRPKVYNVGTVAASPMRGYQLSDQQRVRRSELSRSPKAYLALAGVHAGNIGRKHSDETRARQSKGIAESLRRNPEIVRRRADMLRGRPFSNAHKAALKASWAIRERKPVTHCKRGHEYTPDNVVTHRGMRSCRICRRAADRAYRKRCRQAVA